MELGEFREVAERDIVPFFKTVADEAHGLPLSVILEFPHGLLVAVTDVFLHQVFGRICVAIDDRLHERPVDVSVAGPVCRTVRCPACRAFDQHQSFKFLTEQRTIRTLRDVSMNGDIGV